MTPDIRVQKKRCDCNPGNSVEKQNSCKYTVLESSGGSISLRKYSVPINKPSQWNLALVGLPRHPNFDKLFEEVSSVSYMSIQMEPEGETSPNYS